VTPQEVQSNCTAPAPPKQKPPVLVLVVEVDVGALTGVLGVVAGAAVVDGVVLELELITLVERVVLVEEGIEVAASAWETLAISEEMLASTARELRMEVEVTVDSGLNV
jgi:hypothetical protein